MICPTCSLGEISPETLRCELCGFDPAATSAGEIPNAVAVDGLARQELAEHLHLDACLSRVANTAVYLARQPGSARAIVVKLVQRPVDGRAEADERFKSAAAAVAALKLRHAVRVLGSGWTDHFYWYSMEPVRELSLRSVLRALGAALMEAWQWLVAVVARIPRRLRYLRLAGTRRLRHLAIALRPKVVKAQQFIVASARRARARWRAARLAGERALGNLAIAVGRGALKAGQRIEAWWWRVVERWDSARRVAGPWLREAIRALGVTVVKARQGITAQTARALNRVRRRDAVRVVAASAAGPIAGEAGTGRVGAGDQPQGAAHLGVEIAPDAAASGRAPGRVARGEEAARPPRPRGGTEGAGAGKGSGARVSGPGAPERGGIEAAPVESVETLAQAELVGQVGLAKCLSSGTSTAVYLAQELGTGHAVVVKVLRRPAQGRPEDEDRFRSVAAAAAAVERARSSGWTEHLYWYSTEPERVGPLRKAIRALAPLVHEARQRIAEQVARALDFMRRRDVVPADGESEIVGPDDEERDASWGGANVLVPGPAPGVTDHPGEPGWHGGIGREAPAEGWTPQPPWEPHAPHEGEGAGLAAVGDGGRGPAPGTTDEHGGTPRVAEHCPNCLVGEISPLTHRCGLCGRDPKELVAVRAPRVEVIDDLARQELAEQFRLDEVLGFGATTAVYLARAQGSDRQIAVKVLPRPSEGRIDADERFGRAVESVAALVHPQIVPVIEHGWTEHLYWYSMGHVRGRSLRKVLLERGSLDLKGCLRITTQVAGALDYAHRRGVVHGAVKPENVLMDEDGWIHVCDLLVTRALEPANPVGPPSAPSGLPADMPALASSEPAESSAPYSAPEGLWTPSADQYSLAVLVAECLTGSPLRAPQRGTAAGRPSPVPTGVPQHVRHALERALSERPVDRFAGVLDFVAALERYTALAPELQPSGSSTVVLRQTDWTPPGHPVRRRLVAVGVVALLAAVGAWKGPAAVRAVRGFFSPTQPLGVVPFVTDNPEQAIPKPRPEDLRPLPEAPAPETAKPGLLFVNATPWGQLYVDGELMGNTPKGNLVLTAGQHTVRVLREGYESYDRTVTIAAGQSLRLTDITLAPRP